MFEVRSSILCSHIFLFSFSYLLTGPTFFLCFQSFIFTDRPAQNNIIYLFFTALAQLWNIDNGYIAVGRDTYNGYIYQWYRQGNKCHGWTSGYSRLSSNAKPYLNAENRPLVILVAGILSS